MEQSTSRNYSEPNAPVGGESSRPLTFPVLATYVLLAANVAIFVLTALLAAHESPLWKEGLYLWLSGRPQSPQQEAFFIDLLLSFGAAYGPYLERGEYWRLVTPMFLHGGIIHLGINSYALLILGTILERVYGYGRFSLVYVMSGAAGCAASMILSERTSVGASGAIFGIAGALLVVGFRHPQIVPRGMRGAFGRGILPMIVLNLFLGSIIPFIDQWGHLVGLLGGAVMAFLIPPPAAERSAERDLGPEGEASPQAFLWVPLLIVALAFAFEVEHYLKASEFRQSSAAPLEEADQHLARGKYQDALTVLDSLAQDDQPLPPRLAVPLARAHLGMGDVEKAEALLDETLRENPRLVEGQIVLAAVYRKQGNPAKAERQYRLLLAPFDRSPDDPQARLFLADLCLHMHFYEEGIIHYQRALELDPNNPFVHNNLAWLYGTAENPAYRNPASALEHARRAVTLSEWKEATIIDTLAEAFYVNGHYPEAVATQEKALALRPDDAELQAHMERYRRALTERRT